MIGLAKRRKGRLVNVAMMRFLCGLDVHEFSLLFADVLSVMVAEFPRTPIETANREGPEKMTLHLILFLTLMRLKTLLSLRCASKIFYYILFEPKLTKAHPAGFSMGSRDGPSATLEGPSIGARRC
mmetsp:Transcript_16666/g.42982  ORF Transcript_16666/g.42982 Transcript_16666/m.42982 type:complete len:126 (+) Transcript_16666:587-964(+)